MSAGSQKVLLVAKTECPGPSRPQTNALLLAHFVLPACLPQIFDGKIEAKKHQDQPNATAEFCNANRTSESMKLNKISMDLQTTKRFWTMHWKGTSHCRARGYFGLLRHNSVHLYNVSSRVEFPNSGGLVLWQCLFQECLSHQCQKYHPHIHFHNKRQVLETQTPFTSICLH